MKPNISEFSYGYALTRELTKKHSLVGAPEFPSLYQEGREGGGYDVKIPRIGIPLFVQFKLSHYMKRSNAKEAKQLGLPYYRMYLRPLKQSNQHSLLLKLEKQNYEVYYAAPRFYTSAELNEAYLNESVLQNSLFIRPGKIGDLPDEKEHYIVFNSNKKFFCSQPRPVESESIRELFGNYLPRIVESSRAKLIDHHFFLSLGENLLSVYESSLLLDDRLDLRHWADTDKSADELLNILSEEDFMNVMELRNLRVLKRFNKDHSDEYARYIGRNLFGCELFLYLQA